MFFNIYSFSTKKHSFIEKFKYLFFSLILYLFFTFISVILIFAIDYYITNILNYPSISNLFSSANKAIDKNGLLKIIIFVPLFEELLFRLPLKPNKWNMAIFTCVFSFFMLNGKIFSLEFNSFLFLSILISLSLAILFFLKYTFLTPMLNKNYKMIIIFSILLFGLVHITNIEPLYFNLSIFYPIYVLPQIIMGYFISNLRIKFGFFWGLAFHMLINTIGSLHLIM